MQVERSTGSDTQVECDQVMDVIWECLSSSPPSVTLHQSESAVRGAVDLIVLMFSFIGGVNLLFIDLQQHTNKLEFDVCDKKSPDWVKTPEEPGLSSVWVTLGRQWLGRVLNLYFIGQLFL